MKNLKYILMAAVIVIGAGYEAAFGADVVNKAQQYAAAPEYARNWTGGYIGLNVGYGQKNQDTNFVGNTPFANAILASGFFPNTVGLNPSGLTVGVRAGYDLQIAPRWVVGGILGWSYSGMKDNQYLGGNLVGVQYSEKITNIFDVLARVGYNINEKTLWYVAGGGTGATVNNTVTGSGIICAIGACVAGASNDTKFGWTIGTGVEAIVAETRGSRTSLYAEYLYSDLGTQTTLVTVPPIPAAALSFNNNERVQINRVSFGANHKF